MKRKSKILIGSAIVFVALFVALFLARQQFVGGPGSPTVEGSRAVRDGGIKIPGWNGRVDAAEERAGMTRDAARLVGEGHALHVTNGPATSLLEDRLDGVRGLHRQSDIRRAKIPESQLSPASLRSVIGGNNMGTPSQTELYGAASRNGELIVRRLGPEPFRVTGLLGESTTAIHKAAGRGQPVTQDISLWVRGDKVVCSINGSIVASYDKTTLVGSGKLTSTNGYYGLRFAHNTDVFVSNLLATSTK